ncbi:unnamed protein product, partial [Scytosiphon promiscuus]
MHPAPYSLQNICRVPFLVRPAAQQPELRGLLPARREQPWLRTIQSETRVYRGLRGSPRCVFRLPLAEQFDPVFEKMMNEGDSDDNNESAPMIAREGSAAAESSG